MDRPIISKEELLAKIIPPEYQDFALKCVLAWCCLCWGAGAVYLLTLGFKRYVRQLKAEAEEHRRNQAAKEKQQ